MVKRILLVLVVGIALVGGVAAAPVSPVGAADAPAIQPDAEVVFDSGGVPIHASVRLPASGSTGVPAAVIIGGSGNLDRDGNSPPPAVELDPYLWVADQLSAQGVASIRYDKLGTGATGLGPYEADPDALLSKDFDQLRVQPARDALAYLGAQPGIDPTRLLVIGHSEGGMVTLALDANPGDGPRPAGLVLLEPQYTRILDIISIQLSGGIASQVELGQIDPADAQVLVDWMDAGIAEIRAGTPPYPTPGPVPLPGATGVTAAFQGAILASVYSSDPTLMVQSQAMRDLYGKTGDLLDPVVLARSVKVPTLITCGTRDVETPCALDGPSGAGVSGIVAELPAATTTFVVAPGTVHFLRDVGDANPTTAELAGYPYSTDIQVALSDFAASFVPAAPTPPTPALPVVVTPVFTG